MATQAQIDQFLQAFYQSWNNSVQDRRAYNTAIAIAETRTGLTVGTVSGPVPADVTARLISPDVLPNFNQLSVRSVDSAGTVVSEAQAARDDRANTQLPSTSPGVLTPDGRIQPTTPGNTNAQILPTTETNPTTGTDAPTRTTEATQAITARQTFAENDPRRVDAPAGSAGVGAGENAVVNPSGPGAASNPDDNTVSRTPRQDATPAGNSNNPPGGTVVNPQDNILDAYQSYTYNISVYMISTSTYRTIATSKVFSPAGSQLLFSSGGAPAPGTSDPIFGQRSDFFPTDYYIDNIELTSLLANKGTGMPHNSVELNFTVTETNGITLLQNLSAAVTQQSATAGDSRSYLNQMYLMVIKFYGYDEAGNLVSGDSGPGPTITKYIPFVISELGFKIASRAVEYNWKCLTVQDIVNTGPKFATVPFNIEYSAITLKDSIETLLNSMNKFQNRLFEQKLIKIPNTYSVEFTSEDIAKARVQFDGVPNKKTTPMNSGETAADQKLPSKQSAKLESRRFSVTAGTQLTQFIEQTVRTSEYIIKQQNVLIDGETNKTSENPQAPSKVEWFKINRFAVPKDWDDIVQDFAYDIVYTISPYTISSIGSEYFNNPPFPGFHKRYPYWFTGENTAVISYEQEFNALYYLTLSGLTGPGTPRSYFPGVKKAYQTSSAQSAQNTPGIVGEPGANAADYLYSPGEQGEANITIIGDPAWIFQGEVVGGLRKGQWTRGPFLADGTINTDAGEALFEIAFNLPNDYDVNGSGLADPNDLSTQAARPGLSGPSRQSYPYQALQVVSKFRKGQFTQDITGLLVVTKEAADAARGAPPVSYNAPANVTETLPNPNSPQSNFSTNVTGTDLSSAISQGVNQALQPVTEAVNATIAQIQGSQAYITARQAGLSAEDAVNFAKQAFSTGTAGQPYSPSSNIVKDSNPG